MVEGVAWGSLNRPTNVAFGRDTDFLYYANYGGGEIGMVKVGERGMPLNYPVLPRPSEAQS